MTVFAAACHPKEKRLDPGVQDMLSQDRLQLETFGR